MYGYQATGKTTSARQLYKCFSKDYKCLLLSTLDYRKQYNLFDLFSEEQRNDVYNYLIHYLIKFQKNSQYEIIIID